VIPAEEYCRRHKLRCPIIKRPESKLHMFYRADFSQWKSNWIIFSIGIGTENYHPSYYKFTWMRPYHNGSFNGRALEALADPLRVEWDEYDIEIIKAAQRDDGLTPIADLSEVKMAVWEMFLFCADDQAATLPRCIRLEIYKSLDRDTSIEKRMRAQRQVEDYFKEASSAFSSRWSQMEQYYAPGSYAAWYANLVNQMRDNAYRQDFGDLQSVV